jgi:hypothetical protein
MEPMSADWRKSSYSSNGGQNCVEVGNDCGGVLVRDTKDKGCGPVLSVSVNDWRRLTAGVKADKPM